MRLYVPAIHYRAQAIVDRTWGWSPVEETILLTLNNTPGTIDALSDLLAIPRQVASAAVIRLMQFGLIELRLDPSPALTTSDAGREHILSGRPLPERTSHREISVSLVYEKLGGSAFRNKHVIHRSLTDTTRADKLIAFPDNDPRETDETMEQRVKHLLGGNLRHGESLSSIRTMHSQISRRYLEIDLNDAANGAWPEGASDELRRAVAKIIKTGSLPLLRATPTRPPATGVTIGSQFAPSQFILGGDEHLERFEQIVDAAQSDIFILSTFVADQDDPRTAGRQERICKALERACGRGVRCHLFYGSSLDNMAKHAKALEQLRRRLVQYCRVSDYVLAHHKSVRSHAKILAADNGEGGARMVLGSCNWLQSPFRSLELSAEVHDREVVAVGLDVLRAIVATQPEACRSVELMQSMAVDLRRVRSGILDADAEPQCSEVADLTILCGTDHGPLLRRAAHDAKRCFVCCTNKMGATMVSNLFDPAEIAGRRLDDVRILYSRTGGPIKQRHVRAQGERLDGIALVTAVSKPQLHGKFLLWDNDNVVITSFNWGSQTGSTENPLDEVGLHLNGPDLASNLLEAVEAQVDKARRNA